MKKTFIIPFLMVAFVLGLVSCQREEIGSVSGKSFKITAEIQDISTRITYDVDNAKNTITPQWTVNDTIIGFDNNGEKFTFTVTGVDPTTKKAIFDTGEYDPGTATKLYAIYYPGKTIANIVGDTLSVDLSAQSGDTLGNNSPVLMCATADIENNEVNLMFSHQSAVVGIKRCKIGAGETINSVKVSGLVTSGTFKVVNEEMVLVASTETSDITVGDLEITADANGIVGTSDVPAFMFATLPKADAQISIEATTSSSAQYVTLTNLTGNIEKGNYYYADKKLTTDVAAIGNISYGTLSSAFNVASGTATIKILKDCEADATLTVASGNTVTLDLNGKTVTISGDDTAEPKVANRIEVVKGGDLTITDNSSDVVASQGSIVAADGTKGTSNVVAIGGTLTIAGGNIISDPANSSDIDAAVYGKAGATVTVTGGYIRGEGSEGALSVNSSTDDITAGKVCSLTITGGELEYSASKTQTLSTLYIYRSNATISGGHILNSYTEYNGGAAIFADNQSNTTVPVSVNVSGDANIEGKAQYGVRARNGMPVNISGGRISGRKPFVAAGAAHTVSGGELYNTKYGWEVLTAADGATIAVTGGKLYATSTSNLTSVSGTGSNIEFSGSVISNKAFLNDRVKSGFVVDRNVDAENPEYVFKLAQEDNSITATVDGGTYHCTPAGAVQFVNSTSSAVTLTVEKNFSTSRLHFAKDRENLITLDLNGNMISFAEKDQIYLISSSSSLTVTDSSNPSVGAISGCQSAVMVDGGTLTIAGGSFLGNGKNGVIYTTSTATELNITGGMVTCSGGTDGRAVNIGCGGLMSGGTISSSGSGLRLFEEGAATFNVNGESVQVYNTDAADATLLIANSKCKLNIVNGYFFAGNSEKSMQSHATRVNITGGHFNRGSGEKGVTPAAGYSLVSESVEYGDKTYTNKVEATGDAKASVNGEDYPTFKAALEAAVAYNGSVDTVLIQMKDTIKNWATRFNLTNTSNKPICLDLNGKSIEVITDSVFTSSNRLRIKDSKQGNEKGYISTTSAKLFYLNTLKEGLNFIGPLYLDGCIINSTHEATNNYLPGSSVISIFGKSGSTPTVHMMNGAQINKSKKGCGICVQQYGKFYIYDAKVNLNYEKQESDKLDYCFYLAKYANLFVYSGAEIYTKSGQCIRSASQHARIIIYDGSYLWAGDKCLDASSADYWGNTNTSVDGGYFSQDIKGTKETSGSSLAKLKINGTQTTSGGPWDKSGHSHTYHIVPSTE